MSRLHTLLEHYGRDHENATNQAIHLVCVPLILWSIIAMVWTIPVPGTWFQPGAFAGALMAAPFHRTELRACALMVEVNRRLYMDEVSGARLDCFDAFAATVQRLHRQAVARWVAG